MIKEAADEDYTPIFSNKTATSPSQENEQSPADNGNTQSAESSPFTWEPEALKRLERAPEGFMRDCTKALILKHAEKIGTTSITLDVANEGIEQAKQTMEEAMKTGNVKDIIARLTTPGVQSGAEHNG